MDRLFSNWEKDDAISAAGVKAGFFARKPRVFPWWGKVCQTLLDDFLKLLRPIMYAKEDVFIDPLSDDERLARFDALGKEHADIFDAAIKLFDDALLAIEREDNLSPPAASHPPAPSQPVLSSDVVPSPATSSPDLPDTTTAPSSPIVNSSPPTSLDAAEPAGKSAVAKGGLKRKSDEPDRDGASSKRTRSSGRKAKKAVQDQEIKPPLRRSLRLRKAQSA